MRNGLTVYGLTLLALAASAPVHASTFVGADSFACQARARGDRNQNVVLTLRVKVLVAAP